MKRICEYFCLVALVIFALNMDSQTKRSDSLEPTFAPLQEGQGSFNADIQDGSRVVQVKDLSFFGVTSLSHIKSEHDDSVSGFDLAELDELSVTEAHFSSQRFSDQVFTRVKIKTRPLGRKKEGKTVSGLLVPRNIVVCGKELETGLKRAWLISKIDKIIMHHDKYAPAYFPPADGNEGVSSGTSESEKKIQGKKKEVKIAKTKELVRLDVPVVEQETVNESNQEIDDQPSIFSSFQALLHALYDFIVSIITSITELIY